MNRRELLLASAAVALIGTGAQAAEAPYGWTTIPFGGGGYIDGFLYHPKQKDLLYARTDIGGMYRYDFAGKRWIALLDHLGHDDAELMGVLSMAIDVNDPNRIYAACGLYLPDWARKGAILRSHDQGRTWQKTELPIRVGGNADGRGSGDRLVVDPKDGNVLWYGSNQDGLWKSTDAGASFNKVNGPATHISLVLIDPVSGVIHAGGYDARAGLFVSTDAGASWQPVDGTPAQMPQHAVFAADGSLYVTFAHGDGRNVVNPSYASQGGVWKRDAKSGKWHDISPIKPVGGASFGFSGVDVGPDGMVVVSTLDRWWPGDEVYISKDGGDKWIALGDQSKHDASAYPWLVNFLKGQDRMGHWISDLKINPFNADEMIYGTGYGLWMSENLTRAGTGETIRFAFNITDLEETATIQMTSPTGGAIVLAALGDVGGAAWDDLTATPATGLFTPASETNFSVDYGGQAPAFVARTTNSGNHGMYSEDAGASWTSFPASPYRRPADGQPWKSSGIITVSAKATSLLWVPEKEGAWYSTDKGRTWKEAAGWPTARDQGLTPVSDKVMDGVFYVHDRFAGAILISVDHGASFKAIVSGLPKVEGWQNAQLAVVPTRMRDLWFAAPYGLLHSRDADAAMTQVRDVDVAWCVGFGAAKVKDGYPAVYLSGKVKGREGLWRSDDEGKSWVRINDDAHQFGHFRAIAGDPLEWGTLYIAPHGRGLLVGKPGGGTL